MITQEILKNRFYYKEGHLYYKYDTNNQMKKDSLAGRENQGKYRIKVNTKLYLAHRLIFLYHHGYLPDFVDHIDRNPLNNKIENLRAATKRQNCQNKVQPKGISNVKGITFAVRLKKWRARIKTETKRIHLGYFNTIEEATVVMREARIKYHGEFACHD